MTSSRTGDLAPGKIHMGCEDVAGSLGRQRTNLRATAVLRRTSLRAAVLRRTSLRAAVLRWTSLRAAVSEILQLCPHIPWVCAWLSLRLAALVRICGKQAAMLV